MSGATVRKVVKNLPSDKITAGDVPINVEKKRLLFFKTEKMNKWSFSKQNVSRYFKSF